MSHSPTLEPHHDMEDQPPCEVIACLTMYSTPQNSTGKGRKSKKAPVKETRAKEFTHTFTLTMVNYIAFLQKILDKHHLHKSNASYIVNLEEYQTLANKILKRMPTRPIVVFVEMPVVKKALSKKKKKTGFQSSSDYDDGLGGMLVKTLMQMR
ncbi:hypothetical protein EI94DRAFT_1708178 [Lactarius quietus]|nr:hypothetical protein EI94DRAFT_1708178 [Lactarius quietus]